MTPAEQLEKLAAEFTDQVTQFPSKMQEWKEVRWVDADRNAVREWFHEKLRALTAELCTDPTLEKNIQETLRDVLINEKCSCISGGFHPCPRCRVTLDEVLEILSGTPGQAEWSEEYNASEPTDELRQPDAPRHIRPTLTFGDGDYSCASCGVGMDEPCIHWRQFLVLNAAPDATGQTLTECPLPASILRTLLVDHEPRWNEGGGFYECRCEQTFSGYSLWIEHLVTTIKPLPALTGEELK